MALPGYWYQFLWSSKSINQIVPVISHNTSSPYLSRNSQVTAICVQFNLRGSRFNPANLCYFYFNFTSSICWIKPLQSVDQVIYGNAIDCNVNVFRNTIGFLSSVLARAPIFSTIASIRMQELLVIRFCVPHYEV